MATLLFLVARGLRLIFGVGNIFNFAHGSSYMLAAYFGYQLVFNRLVGAIESASGRKFSPEEHRALAAGADEEDLVNSGLEETMITSWQQIKATRERLGNKVTPRIAAFVTAIDKIATSYQDLGIFP